MRGAIGLLKILVPVTVMRVFRANFSINFLVFNLATEGGQEFCRRVCFSILKNLASNLEKKPTRNFFLISSKQSK